MTIPVWDGHPGLMYSSTRLLETCGLQTNLATCIAYRLFHTFRNMLIGLHSPHGQKITNTTAI